MEMAVEDIMDTDKGKCSPPHPPCLDNSDYLIPAEGFISRRD
jgi:hypothetical protein